jgi:hypothetical protein
MNTIQPACKQCRAPLTGKRPQARYCNSACRLKAHRGSPANAPESVSSAGGLNPRARPVKRFLGHPRQPERHLRGLLSHLEDQLPGWIESSHTGRTFPRTYAEHGLALPSYMRVEERLATFC